MRYCESTTTLGESRMDRSMHPDLVLYLSMGVPLSIVGLLTHKLDKV
jgi:hypothetical protein